MKKNRLFFMIISIIFYPSLALAGISGTELIEKSKEYDLQEICIRGEIIGDIFIKKDFCWINVSDGTNAIGVWLPRTMTEQFSNPGDYNHRGDIVEITGKFYRTCTEHTGEIDIHADNLVVLKKGEIVNHTVDKARTRIAVILFFIAMAFLIWEMVLRKKVKTNEPES